MKKIPVIIRHIYSKLVIIIGFGIFYFEDLGKLGHFLKTIFGFGGNGFIAMTDKITVINNMYLLIIAVICCLPVLSGINKLTEKSFALKSTMSAFGALACASLLILSSIMLVDATTNPFLYFRF